MKQYKYLQLFNQRLIEDYNNGLLTKQEAMTIFGFANLIIKHITDGNEIEERLVKIMGGVVLETLYDKAINEGKEQGIEQGTR